MDPQLVAALLGLLLPVVGVASYWLGYDAGAEASHGPCEVELERMAHQVRLLEQMREERDAARGGRE